MFGRLRRQYLALAKSLPTPCTLCVLGGVRLRALCSVLGVGVSWLSPDFLESYSKSCRVGVKGRNFEESCVSRFSRRQAAQLHVYRMQDPKVLNICTRKIRIHIASRSRDGAVSGHRSVIQLTTPSRRTHTH